MATQSEINAALGLPPGINPDGSWNAQDYMARRTPGQVDTQAQVDAARAANPYSAQNMAKVDVTRQGQYVDDASGNPVALTSYSPGFDINNPTALQSFGELRARGGTDSTSQAFNAIATPAQKAEADRLWSIEKARLDAIDRQAGLLNTPTSQTTQTAQTQTAQTYTPAETALYNAYRSGDIAGVNRAAQEGKLTQAQVQSKFGLTDADMSWMTNNAGVKFYTPPAAATAVVPDVTGGTTGILSGIRGAINSGIGQTKTYTPAEEALYNAYRAGNIAEFNRLTAANKFTAGNIQSKFGLSDADMNWITNNAGGKFYSEAGTGPGGVPGGVPGGLGGLGGIAQNFANYQSIPIGAQYNPNVVGGTGSPYAQVMGQMQPFQNPYANIPVNTPMGGYDPGLYDRLLTNAAAKADVLARGGSTIIEGGGDGGVGVGSGDADGAIGIGGTGDAGGPGSGGGGDNGDSGDGGDGLARGGYVHGGLIFGANPPGPDDGAVNLDMGEYVIKKSSVNKYGRGLLDMINEGKVPAKKLKSLLG